MEIEKYIFNIMFASIFWIGVMISFLPAISDTALRILRPQIFNERREHQKQLNKLNRELNKALAENTQLKKQIKQFTYTQPIKEHNVYLK